MNFTVMSSDEELCRRYVEPLIPLLRGKPPSERARAAAELSRTQRSVFAVWTLHVYGDAGASELFRRLEHVISDDYWRALREAAEDLALPELHAFVDRRDDETLERVRSVAITAMARKLRQ